MFDFCTIATRERYGCLNHCECSMRDRKQFSVGRCECSCARLLLVEPSDAEQTPKQRERDSQLDRDKTSSSCSSIDWILNLCDRRDSMISHQLRWTNFKREEQNVDGRIEFGAVPFPFRQWRTATTQSLAYRKAFSVASRIGMTCESQRSRETLSAI